MRIRCKVCDREACDCNGQRCGCGHNVFQLYELQEKKANPVIEQSDTQIYDKFVSAQSQTGKQCQFDGAGVRSKCIYCGQNKFNAGNGYQCQRPE